METTDLPCSWRWSYKETLCSYPVSHHTSACYFSIHWCLDDNSCCYGICQWPLYGILQSKPAPIRPGTSRTFSDIHGGTSWSPSVSHLSTKEKVKIRIEKKEKGAVSDMLEKSALDKFLCCRTSQNFNVLMWIPSLPEGGILTFTTHGRMHW